VLAAANRDPAEFPDPEAFDLARDDSRQIGFGFGTHYCLGANLARAETQVAFETLLRRLPGLHLEADALDVPWRLGPLIVAPTTLPVAW
jgi:cytochrome P450